MDCYDVSSTTLSSLPDINLIQKHIDETVQSVSSPTNTALCKDITNDLVNLDNLEILDCQENESAMDCLGDIQPSFNLSTSIENEDSVLPVYGPFAEFESQTPIDSDVMADDAVSGVCGLRNLGNTCFMNAGLQCLLNNRVFRTYFGETELSAFPPASLSLHFAQLMRKTWSGSYTTLHLGDFKECFGSLHNQFRNYRQHDCQEFLALLLDTMHEELNAFNRAKSSNAFNNHINNCLQETEVTSTQKEVETKVESILGSPINDHSFLSDSTAQPHKESNAALYEKNTEKMADLLINNKKQDKALIKTSDIALLCNSSHCHAILEKNELISKKCGPSIEDFVKATKTLNTNVLVSEEEPNNRLKFGSYKYPKMDNNRLEETVDNLGSVVLGLSKQKSTGLKRVKITNILHEEHTPEKNLCEQHKRFKVDDTTEVEELSEGGSSSPSTDPQELLVAEEIRRGYSAWDSYTALNQSVIVDIFHGQFRSSVVCNQCSHNSITYEPFMYLPVFLPHTLERQIVVTYIANNGSTPVRYLLTVNKYDRIVKIREALQQHLDAPSQEILLAEVFQNHISRILDENQSIRRVNDSSRLVYAFEVGHNNPPSNTTPSELEEAEEELPSPSSKPIGSHMCTICLEELPDYKLQLHPGCECILCNTCIEVSCKHYGGSTFICPVCSCPVSPADDFVSLSKAGEKDFKHSTLPVALVLRNDVTDGEHTLIGQPGLLKIPSSIPGNQLYAKVDRIVSSSTEYSLLLVDGQGLSCSRCDYAAHCGGCTVPRNGSAVHLLHGDTLAVQYKNLTPAAVIAASQVHEHMSMRQTRHKQQLDIYDCLEYFSERESLDEASPWYCPVCRQNQQATKSLSVWKFPDVLIIYLKRFVFHNFVCLKVEDKVSYPIEGLDLSSFASGPEELIYDLQSCVCHFGGVSAGHYTSYSRHAVSDEWYYYNDDNVQKEAPKTEDCVNEYIFFYQKR